MDEQTRKTWSRPELIVIVRGGPEEAVLDVCKTAIGIVGPLSLHSKCSRNASCVQKCDVLATS